MDALGLAIEIGIVGDGNDPHVTSGLAMEYAEVASVACQDGTALALGEVELVSVINGLICPSRLERCLHIVAKLPELFHDGKWEILIGVKMGHGALKLPR